MEEEKIQGKDDLNPIDKMRVMRCAKNYSSSIRKLIVKSKDRLSEVFDSKLREKSASPSSYLRSRQANMLSSDLDLGAQTQQPMYEHTL